MHSILKKRMAELNHIRTVKRQPYTGQVQLKDQSCRAGWDIIIDSKLSALSRKRPSKRTASEGLALWAATAR